MQNEKFYQSKFQENPKTTQDSKSGKSFFICRSKEPLKYFLAELNVKLTLKLATVSELKRASTKGGRKRRKGLKSVRHIGQTGTTG